MAGIKEVSEVRKGGLFTTNGRDVWRILYYCEEPTVTLENVETKERRGGAIGCRNLADFVRLDPVEPVGPGPLKRTEGFYTC